MSSWSQSGSSSDAERLVAFLRLHRRVAVLSGAGCSTESGIPEYRDDDGNWKHREPMKFAEFVNDESKRKRYWAQSFAGWHRISTARPNAAHYAIADLEQSGCLSGVITQNVDNLHRVAGSRNVIDLHGTLQFVRCLECAAVDSRHDYQCRLRDYNQGFRASLTSIAPDGDARITGDDLRSLNVPGCAICGGIVKPDVVFFGEAVPQLRTRQAKRLLEQSDALLVVGSSLMVFSGFRLARLAREAGKPIAIVNRGATRADAFATCKVTASCAGLLSQAVRRLAA